MHAAQKTRHHSRPPLACWPLVPRCAALGLLGAMLAGWVVAAEAPNPPGERLGTLFYSTAERNAVVRARQGNTDAKVDAAPVNSPMTVNGVVKRNSGHSTVWVNGQAVPEGQSVPPATRTSISASGATLDGKRVQVGETLDLTTLERSDLVAPGAVTIKVPK